MEQLPNGYTLEIPEGCFPLSTDSMVLSHFVRLPKNARVLDLGSGCGTLGLLLCSRDENCRVTGLELDEAAHRAALENIRRNTLTRLESIRADLRQIGEYIPAGSISVCVSNPPYYTGGPVSQATPTARRDDCCTCADLMRAAAHALKFGGDFFLVHKPEKLAELIARGAENKLEAKRLLLLRHREQGPVNLILLQFRKGGKPGLILEEESLFHPDGTSTPFYHMIYHIR